MINNLASLSFIITQHKDTTEALQCATLNTTRHDILKAPSKNFNFSNNNINKRYTWYIVRCYDNALRSKDAIFFSYKHGDNVERLEVLYLSVILTQKA